MSCNEFDEYCKTKSYITNYEDKIRKMFREMTRPNYTYTIGDMYFSYKEKGKRKGKMVYDVECFILIVDLDNLYVKVRHNSINFRSFDFDSLSIKLLDAINRY